MLGENLGSFLAETIRLAEDKFLSADLEDV
jgi:hypothetical protein